MLLLSVLLPDNRVCVMECEKQDALRLVGAITWQQGDHVSQYLQVGAWKFQATFEDNVLFQHAASHSNSNTQLRPE